MGKVHGFLGLGFSAFVGYRVHRVHKAQGLGLRVLGVCRVYRGFIICRV